MDPKDFFRGFFGFNHSKYKGFFSKIASSISKCLLIHFSRQGYPPFGHEDNQNADRGGDQETFDVFTNPLDMERFFNQQMEAILKNFGMSEGFYSKANQCIISCLDSFIDRHLFLRLSRICSSSTG